MKEGKPTHFSILAWRIPWTAEPGRLQSMESQSDMTEASWHACTLSRMILRIAEESFKNPCSIRNTCRQCRKDLRAGTVSGLTGQGSVGLPQVLAQLVRN